jgi:hypothetical protein
MLHFQANEVVSAHAGEVLHLREELERQGARLLLLRGELNHSQQERDRERLEQRTELMEVQVFNDVLHDVEQASRCIDLASFPL